MPTRTSVLLLVIPFLLGMGAMRVLDSTTESNKTPELERVTIMRPIAHEDVPKPEAKLVEVAEPSPSTTMPAGESQTTEPLPPLAVESTDTGVVEFVYDGDTVRLADKRKIRLIGIDTPEMNYNAGEPDCYAREAKKQLESLVLKKTISLVPDAEDKDRYGRLLRYIYVTDASGQTFVNNALVVHGGAHAKRYGRNTAQASLLEASMHTAQSGKVGLWGVCK